MPSGLAPTTFFYFLPFECWKEGIFLSWKINALNQSLITLAEGPNDVKLSYTLSITINFEYVRLCLIHLMIIQSRNVLTAMITQQINQRLSFVRYIRVVMNGTTKDQLSLQDNYFALKCNHQMQVWSTLWYFNEGALWPLYYFEYTTDKP